MTVESCVSSSAALTATGLPSRSLSLRACTCAVQAPSSAALDTHAAPTGLCAARCSVQRITARQTMFTLCAQVVHGTRSSVHATATQPPGGHILRISIMSSMVLRSLAHWFHTVRRASVSSSCVCIARARFRFCALHRNCLGGGGGGGIAAHASALDRQCIVRARCQFCTQHQSCR